MNVRFSGSPAAEAANCSRRSASASLSEMGSPRFTKTLPTRRRRNLRALTRPIMLSSRFRAPSSSPTMAPSSTSRSYVMAMGTKNRSRRVPSRNASTFQVSIPSLGAIVLPVRERPPSMKNSWVKPAWIR